MRTLNLCCAGLAACLLVAYLATSASAQIVSSPARSPAVLQERPTEDHVLSSLRSIAPNRPAIEAALGDCVERPRTSVPAGERHLFCDVCVTTVGQGYTDQNLELPTGEIWTAGTYLRRDQYVFTGLFRTGPNGDWILVPEGIVRITASWDELRQIHTKSGFRSSRTPSPDLAEPRTGPPNFREELFEGRFGVPEAVAQRFYRDPALRREAIGEVFLCNAAFHRPA